MTDNSATPTAELVVSGILFDMDGTLIDSTQVVEQLWTEFAVAVGARPEEVIAFAHGRPSRSTVATFAPADEELWNAWVTEAEHSRFGGVVEVPGAAAFVNSLPRGLWAVVTSALHVPAAQRVAAIGIEPPDVLVGAEDVSAGKPDPEGYLAAASALGLDAGECVVFEDTDAGVRAGLAAGCAVVVVGDTASDATAGLPRIRDFAAASAKADGTRIRLKLA